MTTTPNLSLPYLESGQAQKHVTHNEALRMLDALVMLTALDRDLSAPPPAPADGARYIVKAPGAGAFAGKDNQIAHYVDGGWLFHAPAAGWTCFVADESVLLAFDGAGWAPIAAGGGGGAGRELLTANRTYHVRTDGSDANNGLSDTAAGAFLTIQKAVDVIAATLDIAGYNVTVQVGDGTYGGAVTLRNVVGFAAAGNLVIQGNAATPANVLISTATHNFSATGLYTVWDIRDLKIVNSAGNGLRAIGSSLRFANVDFGACAAQHISAQDDGVVEAIGDYAVSGGSTIHFGSSSRGVFKASGRTITFSNSPVFSNAFIFISVGQGLARVDSMTFLNGGIVGGKRYHLDSNSVIYTNGGGANYLPGGLAGVDTGGGQYL